jgi:hypothetical protein
VGRRAAVEGLKAAMWRAWQESSSGELRVRERQGKAESRRAAEMETVAEVSSPSRVMLEEAGIDNHSCSSSL